MSFQPVPSVGHVLSLVFLVGAANAAEPDTLRPWPDYRVILWVGDTAWKRPEKVPLFLERLREMGVDTAMVHGADADPQPYLANHFPYYVENIVNRGLCLKWNSRVTDWDKFVTGWAKGGRPESAFVRDYCLDDPQWLAQASDQVRTAARKHGPHQPLAYDLRDELSVTLSANPFDYDFAPAALAAFRTWLKTQYRDLAGLNAEWETRFAGWDDVRPFTTDQIKNRMASGDAVPRGQPDWQALQQLRFEPAAARRATTRWNFAPWADFRTYMDLSLARTLGNLRQAARELDPRTPVGIEGTQMPHAFGGYDLWRLAQVLDWVEPYDIGNAREIFGSFMPGKPILTTVFEKDTNAARRRLWHLLLEGDRGCIIWWSEDCLDWQSPEYALTPKAKALAPVLKELKSPLARLFLRARREPDPIFILYSQPSIQVDWLLGSTVDGSTWHRRFSSFEAEHNRLAKVRNGWVKALQDLGRSPRFISSVELERLELGPADHCTLVLPQSYALSDREITAVQRVLAGPFTTEPPERLVLADGTPGLFDEHGRLRSQSPLESLFPLATSPQVAYAQRGGRLLRYDGDVAKVPRARLGAAPDLALSDWLDRAGVGSPVAVRPDRRTRIHRFRVGEVLLLAFERNIDYQMSEELKQAGGNETLEKAITLTATLSHLAQPRHVFDLRAGRYLGEGKTWEFALDPWEPSLFALLPARLAPETVMATLLAERQP